MNQVNETIIKWDGVRRYAQAILVKCLNIWRILHGKCRRTVLRTSCWRIRNRTSERRERVRFLIQKQRVRKYRTKHFPCGIVFIIYTLRHSSFWQSFYFKSFKNAKICRYTLTAKWQRKRSISVIVKTFFKSINDCKDMRESNNYK